MLKIFDNSKNLTKTFLDMQKKKQDLESKYASTNKKIIEVHKLELFDPKIKNVASKKLKVLRNDLLDAEQKLTAVDSILSDTKQRLKEALLSEFQDRQKEIEVELGSLETDRGTVQKEFLKSFAKCLYCETLLLGIRHNNSLKLRNEYTLQRDSETISQELDKLAAKDKFSNVHQRAKNLSKETEKINELLTDETALAKEIENLIMTTAEGK